MIKRSAEFNTALEKVIRMIGQKIIACVFKITQPLSGYPPFMKRKQINMLRNIIQAVFLAIILTSCQREVSIVQRLNNDPLLVKIITLSPQNDSSIITYDYDSNDRLIKITYYDRYPASGTTMLPSWQQYTRDAIGRVKTITGVGRSVMNPTVEITSSATVYYINDTSTQVAYIVNGSNTNKTVFTYNNSEQVIKTESFQQLQPGGQLQIVAYHTYQYDATGNLIERKEFTDPDNNGSFDWNFTYKLQYDGKVNPMYRADDILIEGGWLDVSPGNCLKMITDNPYPTIKDTLLQQFTYRSDSRPQTVSVSGNSIQQSFRTYFYQ